jgi:DNA-binding MarR family transcriptional regulator
MTAAPGSHEPATEALLALSRTMTAVLARTLGRVATVSVPQLRVLVLLDTRGPMNLKALAENLGVNASNASRTCEQLVAAGLLERSRLPQQDRRRVVMRLTTAGADLAASLRDSQRTVLRAVADRMSATDRELLVHVTGAVLEATATAPEVGPLGRPDGRLIPWLL